MFEYTSYFENDVLAKQSYIKRMWCEEVLTSRNFVEEQPDGRFRFWGKIAEYSDRFLRVVTLSGQKTIHNAFFDRGFKEIKK